MSNPLSVSIYWTSSSMSFIVCFLRSVLMGLRRRAQEWPRRCYPSDVKFTRPQSEHNGNLNEETTQSTGSYRSEILPGSVTMRKIGYTKERRFWSTPTVACNHVVPPHPSSIFQSRLLSPFDWDQITDGPRIT